MQRFGSERGRYSFFILGIRFNPGISDLLRYFGLTSGTID
jgi:hypothetical protein